MARQSWNKRLASTVSRLGAQLGPSGDEQAFAKPKFTSLPTYKSIRNYEKVGNMLGIETPFFRVIEDSDACRLTIDGKPYVNYARGDYLGLNYHPAVRSAARDALDRFGTSVSASRMVAGDTPLHRELEAEIADFLGLDEALVFVSGHASNVSTIGTVMTEDDLVIYDEFVHNSSVIGMRLSRATLQAFRHNDYEQLESILRTERAKYRNVLVIIEGLYSTEGDVPDLARIADIKDHYGAWLMLDDAHGLGVLGKTGRGVAEHCGVDARRVDIWMGTLSKTLASCGGFIAGDRALIDVLKHSAPGFVYSVGLPLAMTAAALASLRVIKAEPERVARLRSNGALFLDVAKAAGLNTGPSIGRGMLPIIAGDVVRSIRLWHKVFARGLNPSLIVHPGVPMKAGRLRFFLTSEHRPEQIREAIEITRDELSRY